MFRIELDLLSTGLQFCLITQTKNNTLQITMAQAGLRNFYPVRRRREDDTQTAVKRWKLTETSHLEVSANKEQLDAMINDFTLDTSDISTGETSAAVKKPTTRSRTAGGRSMTAKKSQSIRGKCSKKSGAIALKDVPNIKTLFEITNHTTSANDEVPHTHTTTTASDECPLPKTSSSTSKSRPLLEAA